MDEQDKGFATKLNRLFTEKLKPDGSQYTQADVIKGTNETVDRVYLWKLLTGRAINPNMRVVQSLAEFFGVEPNYFFENPANTNTPIVTDKHQELLVVLRSLGLDKDEQAAVALMVKRIKQSKEKE